MSADSEKKIPMSEHLFRYLGLLFICLITFGSYYIYDIPGAFPSVPHPTSADPNGTISELEIYYDIGDTQYGILYSVYNFPNMVIVFFGGYLIDTVFGLKKGAMVFCVLVMAGQIIFSLSASYKLYWLALVGRLVFGLGGESLSVAQSTFCATWFNGRSDINFAFAITLGFSRIGSAVNFQVTPELIKSHSIPFAVWFGAITCGVSFISCIILLGLDLIRGKKDKDKEASKNDAVSLKDIAKFPGSVWLIFFVVVFFYVPLFVFITIANNMLASKFPGCDTAILTSIPYYTAAPSPLIGFLIDRVGHNLSFMAGATALMTAAHIVLGFTSANPYIGMIMLGVSYATMAASIWPTIPALIPSSRLGTAYGLAFAFQNAAVALSTLAINAILQDTNKNYHITSAIFTCFAAVGCALCIVLILVDIKNRRINIPSATMKENTKLLNAASSESAPLLVNESAN
ncbi:major facilitator superfamily domain-containing protein 1 [Cavenderia fasciculata]|uniref:Lysosomal dipeptide transporter MFSD1 n=1 Tax=Cavenderia fasciculata TaxID=261658 RepID=F4Q503_CACFS|nr:major facilitator superfamily domain-containing protein 1 [Cavenderia fasciculata]EGG17109.1 major facilitator superfamily domain-containing protein 1 [Cavenderia fasciculata]|eukprot:XP_004355593.1 major facilitator superfamily domain-containing protein 1 [Cavenderia fasciculata]